MNYTTTDEVSQWDAIVSIILQTQYENALNEGFDGSFNEWLLVMSVLENKKEMLDA